MRGGLRPHLAWGLLGAALAICMWFAWTLAGGLGMFACIGLAFVFWYRLGPRGSWMGLVVLGLVMASVLGWQAATGSRCPEGDTKVFMRADRAPIGCTDVRASAGAMAMFFALIAGIGIGAPIYARRVEADAAAEGDALEPVED